MRHYFAVALALFMLWSCDAMAQYLEVEVTRVEDSLTTTTQIPYHPVKPDPAVNPADTLVSWLMSQVAQNGQYEEVKLRQVAHGWMHKWNDAYRRHNKFDDFVAVEAYLTAVGTQKDERYLGVVFVDYSYKVNADGHYTIILPNPIGRLMQLPRSLNVHVIENKNRPGMYAIFMGERYMYRSEEDTRSAFQRIAERCKSHEIWLHDDEYVAGATLASVFGIAPSVSVTPEVLETPEEDLAPNMFVSIRKSMSYSETIELSASVDVYKLWWNMPDGLYRIHGKLNIGARLSRDIATATLTYRVGLGKDLMVGLGGEVGYCSINDYEGFMGGSDISFMARLIGPVFVETVARYSWPGIQAPLMGGGNWNLSVGFGCGF